MTMPEVDQELERLFIATRSATLPDPGARQRVRAALAVRLRAPALVAASPRRTWLPWLVVGLMGLGGATFALVGARPAPRSVSQAVRPVPSLSSSAHADSLAQVAANTTAVASAEPPPVATHVAVPARVERTPPTKASPALPSAPPVGSAAEPYDELALVRDMQAALRAGASARALELANEHARRFPRGALVEEREGLRAVARCQLAAPEARSDIQAGFLRSFAGSPYAARVKAACR